MRSLLFYVRRLTGVLGFVFARADKRNSPVRLLQPSRAPLVTFHSLDNELIILTLAHDERSA